MNDSKTTDRGTKRGLDSMAWYGLAAGAAAMGAGTDAAAAVIEVTANISHDVSAGRFSAAFDIAGDASSNGDDFFLDSAIAGGGEVSVGFYTYGGLVESVTTPDYVQLLQAGDTVGPTDILDVGYSRAATDFPSNGYGALPEAPRALVDGIIGFRITLNGGTTTHYGYATGLTYDIDDPINPSFISIGSFFYESTPDTPITVTAIPEPSGLALLAAGAAGVLGLRRHRKVA
ncbi:MAG: PEP-CTERM sorting domain-containing protein [Planctomycetota bacterium]